MTLWGDPWLAQLVEREALDLGVGVEYFLRAHNNRRRY